MPHSLQIVHNDSEALKQISKTLKRAVSCSVCWFASCSFAYNMPCWLMVAHRFVSRQQTTVVNLFDCCWLGDNLKIVIGNIFWKFCLFRPFPAIQSIAGTVHTRPWWPITSDNELNSHRPLCNLTSWRLRSNGKHFNGRQFSHYELKTTIAGTKQAFPAE